MSAGEGFCGSDHGGIDPRLCQPKHTQDQRDEAMEVSCAK
jgi:hypothetical protein